MRLLDYEILKSHCLHNVTKQKLGLILENSDQAVLAHNDEFDVEYFNSKGLGYLKEAAAL